MKRTVLIAAAILLVYIVFDTYGERRQLGESAVLNAVAQIIDQGDSQELEAMCPGNRVLFRHPDGSGRCDIEDSPFGSISVRVRIYSDYAAAGTPREPKKVFRIRATDGQIVAIEQIE